MSTKFPHKAVLLAVAFIAWIALLFGYIAPLLISMANTKAAVLGIVLLVATLYFYAFMAHRVALAVLNPPGQEPADKQDSSR